MFKTRMRWENGWIVSILKDGQPVVEMPLEAAIEIGRELTELEAGVDPALPPEQWRLPLRQH